MSCKWDVWCETCDEECGISEANRAVKTMELLVSAREALADLAEAFKDSRWCELTVDGYHVIIDFFREHRGHILKPINEYGDLNVKCGKVVICTEQAPCGGTKFTCEALASDERSGNIHSHHHVAADNHWHNCIDAPSFTEST